MKSGLRGDRIKNILDTAFPTLPPSGCVGTAAAFDGNARWVRCELEQLPELEAIARFMKHNKPGFAEPAEIVIASRPSEDPLAVVFGLPMARVETGEFVQDFVDASTDGRAAQYFTGLPGGLQESDALRHVNWFAVKYGTNGDYGGYRTDAGHLRVADHRPTTSAGAGDPEIRERLEDAKARALIRKGASRQASD